MRTAPLGMDRHASTRSDWVQWAVEPCELPENGIATTPRASDSQGCATSLGTEINIRANSTQVSGVGSRIQDRDSDCGPKVMIPKLLHVIWVGDESLCPDNCIETWRHHHPDWSFRLWDNDALGSRAWRNAEHMRAMSRQEVNGVADLMRWEILAAEGGIVVDADSVCVRTLPEWLRECEAFACWENELDRPGLIAAGYGTCSRGTPQSPTCRSLGSLRAASGSRCKSLIRLRYSHGAEQADERRASGIAR